jgi:PKD repeat protein
MVFKLNTSALKSARRDLYARASTDNIGITDYKWELGDGETKHGLTIEHTYSQTDTYIVTLTVNDEAGNEDTATITITVTKPIARAFLAASINM